MNIRIPDPTQAIALASLKPYSKKLQKRTVEAIKAEVHKDIIYQLSQEISLRIGKKNAYYFLHVNDKIGLVNRDKKLIIPAIYDTIEPFIGYNYRFYNDTLFVVSQE